MKRRVHAPGLHLRNHLGAVDFEWEQHIEHVISGFSVFGFVREFDTEVPGQRCEQLAVGLRNVTPARTDLVRRLQLRFEETGQQVAQAERRTVPLPRVLVDEPLHELTTVGSLVEQDVRSVDISRVVHYQGSTLSADEVLGLVEAEC